VIRSTMTVTDNVGDIGGFLDGYRDTAADTFIATGDEIRPQALQALGVTPGPVKRPIEWTSPKQRMAFFASDGFGKGIPFARATHGPGNIQNAWFLKTNVKTDDFKAVVGNNDPAAQFVYGSLAKSNPGKFQQRFHINTGWLNGYQEATFWLNAFSVLYRQNLRQSFRSRAADFKTRKRAYTRRKSADVQ
jgi:hypothetical protein